MEDNKTIQITIRLKKSAIEKIKKKLNIKRDGTAARRFIEQEALKKNIITFDDI